MSLVSPSQSNPGDEITAARINNPVNQIAAVVNGNIDATNIADSSVSTAKIADDAVTATKLIYGFIRNRQGGTTGANSWQTLGFNNSDTSTTNAFIQCGSVGTASGTVTVTIPTAYTQVPLVFATVNSATSNNTFVRVTAQSTTAFTVTVITDGGALGATETVNWMTVGQ